MSKHVYSSCLGNIYTSDQTGLDYDICPQCGDTDTYIGEVNTYEDLRRLLLEEGYNPIYVEELIERTNL